MSVSLWDNVSSWLWNHWKRKCMVSWISLQLISVVGIMMYLVNKGSNFNCNVLEWDFATSFGSAFSIVNNIKYNVCFCKLCWLLLRHVFDTVSKKEFKLCIFLFVRFLRGIGLYCWFHLKGCYVFSLFFGLQWFVIGINSYFLDHPHPCNPFILSIMPHQLLQLLFTHLQFTYTFKTSLHYNIY